MTSVDHDRLSELFARACELDPAEREAFLDEACAGDSRLRTEVESLLSHDATTAEILHTGALRPEPHRGGRSRAAFGLAGELGHYRIVRPLGRGGMGEVFLAEDTKLDRNVALKVLPEELANDAKFRARFEREAKAIAALSHPNVVTVFSVEEADGTCFITMEWVRGDPLSRLIPSPGFPLQDFLNVACPLAEAIAAAHSRGVTHRDLKPANIMIDDEGRLKVLDFGLAKRTGGSSGVRGVTASGTDTLTAPGEIVGTVSYMSPEQLEGKVADARSDIFSVGVVLHEMATGRRPFEGPTVASIISSILRDVPPAVTEINGALPKNLDRIVKKCLEKDPAARYQKALDLLEDLLELREGIRSSAPARRRASWLAAAGVVAALAVAGGFLYSALRQSPSSLDTAPVATAIRRLTHTGTAVLPLWSPDGKTIAFDGKDAVYLVPAEGGRPVKLAGSDQKQVWNWIPDGSGLLVRSWTEGQVDVIAAPLQGEQQVLATDANFPDLSPDGRRLAYSTDDGGIWVLDTDSRERQQITPTHGPGTAAYKPLWSPDGRQLAYHRWNGNGHEPWLYDFETGTDRRIDEGPVWFGGHFDWTPDGEALVCAGELHGIWSVWRLPINGDPPTQLTPGAELVRHTTVSPDGRSVAYSKSHEVSRLIVLDAETRKDVTPFELSVTMRHASFSADGAGLFFQALVNGRWQVWSGALDGAGESRAVLQAEGTSHFLPTVAEAGQLLHVRADVRALTKFGSTRWSQSLWRSDPDGTRQERIWSAGDRVSRLAPSSYRSERILYTSFLEEGRGAEALRVLEVDGSSRVLFEDDEQYSFQGFDWGPADDRIILSHTTPASGGRVVSVSMLTVDSRERTEVFTAEDHGLTLIEWVTMSPDGSRVAFVAMDADAFHALWFLDLESRETSMVYEIPKRVHLANPVWSPDGRLIAFDVSRATTDIFVAENIGSLRREHVKD